MDVHGHIFLLSGFENTFFLFHLRFSPYPVTTTIIWPTRDRIPHSLIFKRMQIKRIADNIRALFFLIDKLEQRTWRKKVIVELSFFTSWTITSVNAHRRTCKETKVYIYLYISLHENLFGNGCIFNNYSTRTRRIWDDRQPTRRVAPSWL